MKDSTKYNILFFAAVITGIIIIILGAANKNLSVMKIGRLTILASLIFRAFITAKKK